MSPRRPGTLKNLKKPMVFMVFQGFALFVLGPLGDHFWRGLGLILEALGLILGSSWVILGAKMVPRGFQEASNWHPGPTPATKIKIFMWERLRRRLPGSPRHPKWWKIQVPGTSKSMKNHKKTRNRAQRSGARPFPVFARKT